MVEETVGIESHLNPGQKMTVSEASMTVPELNNFILSLLKPLRNARVRVIRHLSNKLKKLRSSKKSSELVEKKCNNMLEEVKELKALKLNNDVVKKLLAKQYTEKDLSKATSPSERGILRLALQKSHFTEAVCKFRREHNDWVSLTEFMLSKHGGRRFRKKNAKISSEKLAKKTLDTADKRAREQFATHDQRHQHNKRPVAMMPGDDRRVTEGVEIPVETEDTGNTAKLNEDKSTEKAWLSSIFCVSKGAEEDNIQADVATPVEPEEPRVKKHKRKDGEAVVFKLDAHMFNKPQGENAMLPLPMDDWERESDPTKEAKMPTGEEDADFFMPITETDKDEISRAGGNILAMADTFDDDGDGNRHSRGRRGRGRGFHFGSSDRGHNRRPSTFDSTRPHRHNDQRAGQPDKEEKVHASWEARRQERNQQKLHIPSSGQVQAKKITFNDDD